MACKEKEIQSLQERVIDLERQLAEAQAVIQAWTPSHGATRQTAVAPQSEPQEQSEIDPENIMIGEASIRRALYVAPYPLMIRREDGHVVMINAAWTKITGYTLEEIPTVDEWTRKAYGEGAAERKSEILNEGFSQNDIKQWGEYEITTRSGEKRIWDFSTASLGIDQVGRRLTIAMAVDMTERKQTEEKLRAARDEATWLARFPGENPNPVIRVSTTGTVLYCNPPAASLRGWRCAMDTKLSRPLLDLAELAVEQNQIVEQDVLLGDKFYSVSAIPLLKQGYLNLYGRDITERKEAEKALAESEHRQREITRLLEADQARLAAILQHLPVGVWIADQTGRMIGSNEQADRIWAGEVPLANSPDEYRKYESWYPESGKLLETEEFPLTVALRTGQPVEPLELKIRRFDGSEGTVLVSAAPIKDRRGVLTGAVGVNVDITERKLAEERFNKAFHASPSALVISRQEDGRIETINDRFVRFFGYSEKDVIGKTSTELGMFVNPADRQEAVKRLQKDKAVRDFELDVRLKSGEVRNASLSVEMIDVGGKNMMLTAIQDVTLRKRAEEHIAYQARLLASVNDAIVGSDAEFRLTAWNAVAESMYGWKATEVLGRNGLEVLQTQWPREDANEMRHKIAETGRWRGEAMQIRKDGTRIPVEVSSMVLRNEQGQITGYVSVNRDITERKQAEQVLLESEQRLKRAQEIANLGSWELDLINNRLTWSDEVYRIFGLEPQQFGATYEAFLEAVHPDDRAAVDNAYSSSIREGRDMYEIEHRVVKHANGEVRIVHEKCEHFRDQNGQIIRSMGMVHDITDRKKAEKQLKDYAQRLERSNRELEQFAFMASHDLQEPLRKIEMFGDMLLERAAALHEQERNYVDRMRNAASRMRDMVEGLLQLSRVTTQGKPFVSVDLSQVTSEVLHDLEGQVRRTGGKVSVEPLPTIEGDDLQLHQLMQNLIGNALKYHQPGIPPEVNISAKQFSGKVQILVEDKGIGFAREDTERVFQPFQRLVGRSQYEGSGMGLAICRRIVERHGGEISALSQPGQGATFIVTLPNRHAQNSGSEL